MTYHDLAEHAVDVFLAATDDELAAPVRWTPLWSARDVLAHLVHNAERALAGAEAPPSDEEAHAYVLGRRGASVSVLTGELAALAPRVEVPAFGPSQEWDIAVHLADVREAWGAPRLPDALRQPVLASALAFLAAVGEPDESVAEYDYERFRALFSRRSNPGVFFS